MRTTVRIDDELLDEMKEQARRESVSLTRILNRALRLGLRAPRARAARRLRYREQAHSMGVPQLALDKALALAAALEDEKVIGKLALRK